MHSGINTIDLRKVSMQDLNHVGGKNSSLGEMLGGLNAANICVPQGFATTADDFRKFLAQNNLDKNINEILSGLDVDDVSELLRVGKIIRDWIMETQFLPDFEKDVRESYGQLTAQIGSEKFSVAVLSSATAEDLPNTSFAGQQETYLNISGIDAVLTSIKRVFSSLYNDRAIA